MWQVTPRITQARVLVEGFNLGLLKALATIPTSFFTNTRTVVRLKKTSYAQKHQQLLFTRQ